MFRNVSEVRVICEYCCHVFSSRSVQARFLRTGGSIFTPPASTSRHQHTALQSWRPGVSHGGSAASYSLTAVSVCLYCTLLIESHVFQVMFAMRELSGPLSFLIEMITYCSFCNEPFSLGVLHLLKVGTLTF